MQMTEGWVAVPCDFGQDYFSVAWSKNSFPTLFHEQSGRKNWRRVDRD